MEISKVMAFISFQMGMNMKESLKILTSMELVFLNFFTMNLMEIYLKESLKMIKEMELEHIFLLTGLYIRVKQKMI